MLITTPRLTMLRNVSFKFQLIQVIEYYMQSLPLSRVSES